MRTSPSYYLMMCLSNCWMNGKQCRPWSDAALCGIILNLIWVYIYYLCRQYLGLLWYYQAFKRALPFLLFPTFFVLLLFPTFFSENTLLSLLFSLKHTHAGLGGSVGCESDWRPGSRGFNPLPHPPTPPTPPPHKVSNILLWRLIMKYFLWSFSPFRWFKKGSCQFLAKECAQYWLTAKRTKPPK